MDRAALETVLMRVKDGALDVDAALEALAQLPFRIAGEHGESLVDTHRELRCGFPEAVYAASKSPEQAADAAAALAAVHDRLLVTRAAPEHARAVLDRLPDAVHDPEARCLAWRKDPAPAPQGRVCVVSAGTSDRSVAGEAVATLDLFDVGVERIDDVGVAGLHRLLARLDSLRAADVVVICAGMEGALPSVIGGLIAVPVVAVPTSVGYGASYGGLAALLAMLNSCAAGIGVVNVDNGFGAGVLAGRIVRTAARARPGRM
ncbi:MAG TPA: nickel pincer cofactor biosynthesis protein LarB [Planctomycetota bacterium]